MDNLTNALIYQREKFFSILSNNYNYNNIIQLFPKDKHFYRCMTSKFETLKYSRSVINWIPSEELIETIISLANIFNIQSIEEINAKTGLFSSLLKKRINQQYLPIKITISDPFDDENT